MKYRAQVSAEFIIVLGAVLVMFLIILSVYGNRSDDYIYRKRYLSAKNRAEQVATAINNAQIGGLGTKVALPLQSTLDDNSPYTINIHPMHHIVEIIWHSKTQVRQYAVSILTANVTGDLTLINSSINISNTEGGIIIEK